MYVRGYVKELDEVEGLFVVFLEIKIGKCYVDLLFRLFDKFWLKIAVMYFSSL